MDFQLLREIRRLVLISMFADDYLMDKFVLKGGSAIDLVYKIDSRASVDIDLSIEKDFDPEELSKVQDKILESLSSIFGEAGYIIFDLNFIRKPLRARPDRPSFWGGYKVEFKILPHEEKHLLDTDISMARNLSQVVGPNNVKRFIIEISKYEYCELKEEAEIDGYTIYVYTPKLLVMEKLRAMCQQMAEYEFNDGQAQPPRQKDIYDIYTLVTHLGIKFSPEDSEILQSVFAIKKVPISLLGLLPKCREDYRDLTTVRDTIIDGTVLLPSDEYFDFVLDIINQISIEGLEKVG